MRPDRPHRLDPADLERVAAAAWPALVTRMLDGWLLRSAAGVTRRSNSALPLPGDGRIGLAERLSAVEQFYRHQGQPAVVAVFDGAWPPGLDGALTGRGYTRDPTSATSVQVAPLRPLIAGAAAGDDAAEITLTGALTGAWTDLWWAVDGRGGPARRAVAEQILESPGPPVCYALATARGRAVGVARGVVDGDWLGLSCMAVEPSARRHGVAAALLRALARTALDRGAERCYLQVVADNAAARRLYACAGFHEHHRYAYFARD